MKFDEVFMRAWEFDLASVVAGFTTGQMHRVQIVMSQGVCADYPLRRHLPYQDDEATTASPSPVLV